MSNDLPVWIQELVDEGRIDEAKAAKMAKLDSKKSKNKTEEELLEKYPHAVAGSHGFDEAANKFYMNVACQTDGCDELRRTYTSDLFQIRHCDDHRKEARKLRKEQERKEYEAFKREREDRDEG